MTSYVVTTVNPATGHELATLRRPRRGGRRAGAADVHAASVVWAATPLGERPPCCARSASC